MEIIEIKIDDILTIRDCRCDKDIIYNGYNHDIQREVTVKIVKTCDYPNINREISIANDLPHIINFIGRRYSPDNTLTYIMFEKYDFRLSEYHKISYDVQSKIQIKDILRDVAMGLEELHGYAFVHRDIRPENIFICDHPLEKGKKCAKIFNLSLSKEMLDGKLNVLLSRDLPQNGYMASELYDRCIGKGGNRGESYSTSSEVFSLGAVYFYALSGGKEMFVSTKKPQQENIKDFAKINGKFKPDYELLNPPFGKRVTNPWEFPLAKQLIECMVNKDPDMRPRAHHILCHPFFWDFAKIEKFFHDLRENKLGNKSNPIQVDLNKFSSDFGNWKSVFVPDEHLLPIKLYRFENSFSGLVIFIRNLVN